MGPHRLAAVGRRGPGGGAGGPSASDGARRCPTPRSACEGPGRRPGVGDDDGGERLAERGLDGRLPAGVDAHEVEQRAEHAVDAGQPLGAGAGVGGVERELEGVDPGDAASDACSAAAWRSASSGLDGGLGRRPGRRSARSISADERALDQLGRVALARAPRRSPRTSSSAMRGGQLLAARLARRRSASTRSTRGPQRPQLAAHLGDGAGGRAPPAPGRARPCACVALQRERRLVRLERGRPRARAPRGRRGRSPAPRGSGRRRPRGWRRRRRRAAGPGPARAPGGARRSAAPRPRARSRSCSTRRSWSPTSSAPRAVSSAPTRHDLGVEPGELGLEPRLGLGARPAWPPPAR